MKKAWRIVTVIVMVALLLGAVCAGVGLMTGANGERIYSVLDNRYHITTYYQLYSEYANDVLDLYTQALNGNPGA